MIVDLKNQVALVTGASRGLGAVIAKRLAAAGAKVAVNSFASRTMAEQVVADIRAKNGIAEVFTANVVEESEVRQMTEAIRQKFGNISILVINATGPQPFIKIEEMKWQDCVNQLEFFVKSPLLLTQAVLPAMKQAQYGRIINIGSEVFEKGVPEFSQYCAAKGAQLGLTRSWAMELAKHNITVNLVAPGWIPTERHTYDAQELKDAYAAGVPMKHMGDHEDIGNAVAFLASDAAKFITGQRLSVNGGNTLG